MQEFDPQVLNEPPIPPPEEFSKRAHVRSMKEYEEMRCLLYTSAVLQHGDSFDGRLRREWHALHDGAMPAESWLEAHNSFATRGSRRRAILRVGYKLSLIHI